MRDSSTKSQRTRETRIRLRIIPNTNRKTKIPSSEITKIIASPLNSYAGTKLPPKDDARNRGPIDPVAPDAPFCRRWCSSKLSKVSPQRENRTKRKDHLESAPTRWVLNPSPWHSTKRPEPRTLRQ